MCMYNIIYTCIRCIMYVLCMYIYTCTNLHTVLEGEFLVMCVRVHDQRYKEGEGKVDICSGRG